MRSAAVFNFISLVFFILTVVAVVVIAALLLGPAPVRQEAALPTPIPEDLFPSLTPSFTHTLTFTPTFPPTFTPNPTSTFTITPSVTPSNTPTITMTPTITNTPSITSTGLPPTPTFTPTGPTATLPPTVSPYLFYARDGIIYRPNANTLGCAWQGIGGQVFDLNNPPQEVATGAYQIRVFNSIFEKVVPIGSNSQYGPLTGWEVQVGSSIDNNTYMVRLESLFGTPLTENVQVTFFTDCARNVAIVNFFQQREP